MVSWYPELILGKDLAGCKFHIWFPKAKGLTEI